MSSEDVCLASQEIRDLVSRGVIRDPVFDESRIQPSSFEPTITDEAYIIDTEGGLFRPNPATTVERSLLELPKRKREKVDISGGFEFKKGFSYLLPLAQSIRRDESFRFLKSSPKSSIGRVFPDTRLLVDYGSSFDEGLDCFREDNGELRTWLLFQPHAFNFILSPGLTLNQERFMRGYNSQLTPREIVELWKQHPLMYADGQRKFATDPNIAEALQIHVDLEGKDTEGIVALRARKNPNPIDLRAKAKYVAEDYFEPVKAKNGVLVVRAGEHYLISSKEVLDVPDNINIELKSQSHMGFRGPLHRAGFIDNGFRGDLVFEVTPQESTDVELHDGMAIGELNVFRTNKPDKIYGEGIGSNYKFQIGPKPAKYFSQFDYKDAARNHKKLDRNVLVQDAKLLLSRRNNPLGFEFISPEAAGELLELIEKKGFFHSRYDCENDELVLQVIPYVLGFGPNKTVFSYVRSANIQDYGDKRLFGKHSLGLGGHIIQTDGPDFVRKGLEREVSQEEVRVTGNSTVPRLVGTMYQPDKPVDKVHFGLVYGFYTDGSIVPKEASIVSGRMVPIGEVQKDSRTGEVYETWSKNLIPSLEVICDLVSKKS